MTRTPHAVLVVDGTGRGHAICELFTRTDPHVTVHYGPGCDVVDHPRIVPAGSVRLDDPRTALAYLAVHPVEFVFVSHIDALSVGYVDELRRAGHRVIGPTAAAAALESSKTRGKEFCRDHGIPVAEFEVFTDAAKAKEYVASRPYRCVVKTDGLTPDGDGSVVCDSPGEALAAIDRFAAEADRAAGTEPGGGAGSGLRLVVEERLTGREISVFALLDGDSALVFPTAMDYKRTLEADAGKNCDGMGSVAPHPCDSPALREELRATLVDPLVRGLRAEGLDFTGFVYVGAMLTPRGPVAIEINARFGDSEAEVVLPGVRGDFTQLCRAVLARDLARHRLDTDGLARCSVALVQGCLDPADPDALVGWPFGPYATGQPVHGLDGPPTATARPVHGLDRPPTGTGPDGPDRTSGPAAGEEAGHAGPGATAGTLVFCANVRRDASGVPRTTGGRVVHVVGAGRTPEQARRRAYARIERISFPGMRYRTDIGTEPATAAAPHADAVPTGK
ncbi:phosphoribosylglycinamide synthetase C domain-containing protein [Streptomyces sp. NPDC053755]|uniref:phosphoribosylamine--glycine ligase n=1 Tax=Streptomyces sp. NPDC053755 TaxID=3155815 RepID=UPI00341EB679